jgi:hypothetical protein
MGIALGFAALDIFVFLLSRPMFSITPFMVCPVQNSISYGTFFLIFITLQYNAN